MEMVIDWKSKVCAYNAIGGSGYDDLYQYSLSTIISYKSDHNSQKFQAIYAILVWYIHYHVHTNNLTSP